MTTKEWLGSWWAPGSEEVGGQLTFGDHGVKLEIFGSLLGRQDFEVGKVLSFLPREPHRLDVIFGISGRRLSVLSAKCESPLLPGMSGSEIWHGEAVLEGHLVDGATEPMFTGVRLELEALPEWARAKGLVVREFLADRRMEVVVEPHELVSALLGQGEKIRLDQASVTSNSRREFKIRQPVRLSIEDTKDSSWPSLLNRWLQPVQVLLWIATGEAGRVENIELMGKFEPPMSRYAKLWISLIEPRVTSRRPAPTDILFFADEFPDGFGSGMERWLTLWEELRHVLGPLYARASAPFAYVNDRFYTAAAGIEAYHRYVAGSDRDTSRIEHQERVERLADLLSEHAPDLKDWATNAARPFNRIPLWRRVVEVCSAVGQVSSRLFGENVETFARAVEDARHGHAHALSSGSSSLSGQWLYLAGDALVWVLRARIMIDLGFPTSLVEGRILRHSRFQWTVERLSDLINGPPKGAA